MPLKEGSSRETISENIRELYHANKGKKKKRKRDQIIAIAMSKAGRSKDGAHRKALGIS
jgi:hypothetical protein